MRGGRDNRAGNLALMTVLARRAKLLAVLGLVLVLGACSSSPEEQLSPEERFVRSVDAKCGEVAARFEDDLAFGESFGLADLKALTQRVTLVKDLRDDVRGMTVPEPRRAAVDGWLSRLDELVTEWETLDAEFRNATPGSDAVLSMRLGLVDNIVEDVGRHADRSGLTTCADVDAWLIFSQE
jgi:hypothetical protein